MNNNKNINVKTLQCPKCGSAKVKHLNDDMFVCSNCETSFIVETNETTINHKHTYKNQAFDNENKTSKRKLVYILLGFILFVFILVIPTFLQKNERNSLFNFTTQKENKNAYKFIRSGSYAFVDKSNSLKVFIIGAVSAVNQDDEKFEDNVFWAVYDVLKGNFDQMNPLILDGHETMENFMISVHRFEDGNIYVNYKNKQILKYDAVTKNLSNLNNEITANVKELQSGIDRISESSLFFSGLNITSKTGKEVTYFPISKMYPIENFRNTSEKVIYPNEKPTVFFASTKSNPSFLVKYNAMHSMGYPFYFNPKIEVTFDDNDHFLSADFDDFWKSYDRLIDFEVLNTDNKVYSMKIIDCHDNYVALGVKTSNNASQPYILQLQDYQGKLLWATNTNETKLEHRGGVLIIQNGVLTSLCCGNYQYYNMKGEFIKNIQLNAVTFNLD